jgi:putative polyketide hydroxylase
VLEAVAELGIGLKFVRIGVDARPSDKEAFPTNLGLLRRGASLVLPDGYLAWRSSIDWPANPVQALTNALGQVSSAVRR